MSESASVEVLSAEVRVLHVGNGQITRSMYRQPDETPVEAPTPYPRWLIIVLRSGAPAIPMR